MSALRTNEVIKEGVLVLRKTGTPKLEYLKITIQDGRVSALDVEAGDENGSPTLIERVSFSFNKIAVEYTPQAGEGMPQGATTGGDQWGESSGGAPMLADAAEFSLKGGDPTAALGQLQKQGRARPE